MIKFLNYSKRKKFIILIIPLLLIIPLVFISIFPIKSAQSSTITFITKWGVTGTNQSEFSFPAGIATDSFENVYVVDSDNNRIQKFNSAGTFLMQWGIAGTANSQFSSPQGIAIDSSENVYVVDTDNNRIQKFNSSGVYITQWGVSGTANSQFNNPKGIAIDASNNVYVVDSDNNRIQKFNSSGVYLTQWGSVGSATGQFSNPFHITVDPWADIYVVDSGNSRIQKFKQDGTYITSWGVLGSNNGEFDSPQGIVVDSSAYVYVTDKNNHRVEIFSLNGTYVSQWGVQGNGDSEFENPNGITVDSSGNVYIADTTNNRISKFSAIIDLGPYCESINPTTFIGTNEVNALIKIGNVVYLGGLFGMQAIDSTTGQQINWTPNIPNSPSGEVPEVFSLAYNPNTQTLYAGTTSGILSFDVSTSTGILNNWTQEFQTTTSSGKINALEIIGNDLFIGGEFDSVDTLPRINLASFDISTPGGVLTNFTADTNPDSHVYTLKFASSRLFVGGDFNSIQSVSQPIIASIDPVTGFVDAAFNPIFDTLNQPFIKSIAYNNGVIYPAGHFDTINAVNPYTNIASLSASTGQPDPSFTPSLNYDVHATVAKNNYLYIGESNENLISGISSAGDLVAYNLTSGAQADWNARDNQGIHALIAENNALYVGLLDNAPSGFKGSNFTKLFKFPQAYAAIGGNDNNIFLAQFDLFSILPTPTLNPTPTLTLTPTVTPINLNSSNSSNSNSNSSTTAPVCSDSKPGIVTNVKATSGPGNGQITLTWESAPSPVNDYSIVYSDNQTIQKWGVVSTGNVTSFVISALNPNVKYYFWVNAINGCMPGDKVGPAFIGGGVVNSISNPSGNIISTNTSGSNATITLLPATGPLELVKTGFIGIILMIVGIGLLLAL